MHKLKAVVVALLGPVMGLLLGGMIGALLLPPVSDPTQGAPGDGFLIMLCAFFGLVLCTVASVSLAVRIWRRTVVRTEHS